jgi:hypothetical protein
MLQHRRPDAVMHCMTTDKLEPEPALTYERPASQYATRRQFRALLVLGLLNLLIVLQFAYFPNVTAAVKQRWAQYQQKRERTAAVKQALALERQAMSFSQPAGGVVWDENPDTAAALLEGEGYKRVRVEDLQYMPLLARWPRGAAAATPDLAKTYVFKLPHFPDLDLGEPVHHDELAVLFLHGLKSPSGQERLVYVQVQGKLDLNESTARGELEPAGLHNNIARTRARAAAPGTFTVTKELRVVAMPCVPGAGEQPPAAVPADKTTLIIHGSGSLGLPLNWHWTPPSGDKPEQIRIEGREMFRFYAGQPDPSDASRFTIDYDVDGRRGTIRGQLRNDGRVEFKPSIGTVAGSRWYLTPPSSRPAAQ